MEFTVKTTLDMTKFKEVVKSAKATRKRHIKYGWIDGKLYPAAHKNAGIPIAQVAHWQEFGLSGSGDVAPIPSRPYFRQAVFISKYRYKPRLAQIFGTALQGRNTNALLASLGNQLVTDYSESVLMQNYDALADSTVARKKHKYQMDDSWIMFSNVKSKVYRTSQDNIK